MSNRSFVHSSSDHDPLANKFLTVCYNEEGKIKRVKDSLCRKKIIENFLYAPQNTVNSKITYTVSQFELIFRTMITKNVLQHIAIKRSIGKNTSWKYENIKL